MNLIKLALETRFGLEKISILYFDNELFYCIDLTKEKSIKIILTSDFSSYQMPVPDKVKGYEFGELYFCLPSYWSVENPSDESICWIFEWLQKIKIYTLNKKTWIGDGHTFDCSKTLTQFSPTIRFNHFFISSPILLEEELKPIQIDNKVIYFWAVIPIYGDEMDYKQSKGTVKLKKKFLNKGVTEKLDEYRQTSLKTRWLFFR